MSKSHAHRHLFAAFETEKPKEQGKGSEEKAPRKNEEPEKIHAHGHLLARFQASQVKSQTIKPHSQKKDVSKEGSQSNQSLATVAHPKIKPTSRKPPVEKEPEVKPPIFTVDLQKTGKKFTPVPEKGSEGSLPAWKRALLAAKKEAAASSKMDSPAEVRIGSTNHEKSETVSSISKSRIESNNKSDQGAALWKSAKMKLLTPKTRYEMLTPKTASLKEWADGLGYQTITTDESNSLPSPPTSSPTRANLTKANLARTASRMIATAKAAGKDKEPTMNNTKTQEKSQDTPQQLYQNQPSIATDSIVHAAEDEINTPQGGTPSTLMSMLFAKKNAEKNDGDGAEGQVHDLAGSLKMNATKSAEILGTETDHESLGNYERKGGAEIGYNGDGECPDVTPATTEMNHPKRGVGSRASAPAALLVSFTPGDAPSNLPSRFPKVASMQALSPEASVKSGDDGTTSNETTPLPIAQHAKHPTAEASSDMDTDYTDSKKGYDMTSFASTLEADTEKVEKQHESINSSPAHLGANKEAMSSESEIKVDKAPSVIAEIASKSISNETSRETWFLHESTVRAAKMNSNSDKSALSQRALTVVRSPWMSANHASYSQRLVGVSPNPLSQSSTTPNLSSMSSSSSSPSSPASRGDGTMARILGGEQVVGVVWVDDKGPTLGLDGISNPSEKKRDPQEPFRRVSLEIERKQDQARKRVADASSQFARAQSVRDQAGAAASSFSMSAATAGAHRSEPLKAEEAGGKGLTMKYAMARLATIINRPYSGRGTTGTGEGSDGGASAGTGLKKWAADTAGDLTEASSLQSRSDLSFQKTMDVMRQKRERLGSSSESLMLSSSFSIASELSPNRGESRDQNAAAEEENNGKTINIENEEKDPFLLHDRVTGGEGAQSKKQEEEQTLIRRKFAGRGKSLILRVVGGDSTITRASTIDSKTIENDGGTVPFDMGNFSTPSSSKDVVDISNEKNLPPSALSTGEQQSNISKQQKSVSFALMEPLSSPSVEPGTSHPTPSSASLSPTTKAMRATTVEQLNADLDALAVERSRRGEKAEMSAPCSLLVVDQHGNASVAGWEEKFLSLSDGVLRTAAYFSLNGRAGTVTTSTEVSFRQVPSSIHKTPNTPIKNSNDTSKPGSFHILMDLKQSSHMSSIAAQSKHLHSFKSESLHSASTASSLSYTGPAKVSVRFQNCKQSSTGFSVEVRVDGIGGVQLAPRRFRQLLDWGILLRQSVYELGLPYAETLADASDSEDTPVKVLEGASCMEFPSPPSSNATSPATSPAPENIDTSIKPKGSAKDFVSIIDASTVAQNHSAVKATKKQNSGVRFDLRASFDSFNVNHGTPREDNLRLSSVSLLDRFYQDSINAAQWKSPLSGTPRQQQQRNVHRLRLRQRQKQQQHRKMPKPQEPEQSSLLLGRHGRSQSTPSMPSSSRSEFFAQTALVEKQRLEQRKQQREEFHSARVTAASNAHGKATIIQERRLMRNRTQNYFQALVSPNAKKAGTGSSAQKWVERVRLQRQRKKKDAVPEHEVQIQQKHRQFVVRKDYDPMNDDELKLRKGEIICLVQVHNDGWWDGFKEDDPDHIMGKFPFNFCTEILTRHSVALVRGRRGMSMGRVTTGMSGRALWF